MEIKPLIKKYRTELWFFVWALFLQAVIFVLTWQFGEKGFLWASDSESYWRLGENLLKHKIFTLDPAWGPTAFRTPLYPLFIAGLLSIIHKLSFAIVVQGIISALNVSLLYNLAKRMFSERVAFVASLLFSLEAARLFMGSQLMSETLFLTFFIVATFFFISFLFQNGSWQKLFWGLICLGLATMLRPITQFFPIFLFLFFIVLGIIRKEYKRYIVAAFLVVVINLAMMAPWMIRNKIIFGELKLSPLGGIQLYLVNLPHYLEDKAKQSGEAREYYQPLLDQLEKDLNIKINYENWTFESIRLMEFKYEEYLTSKFFETVKADPFGYATVHLKRSAVFMIESGASQYYRAMLAHTSIPNFVFYPLLYWGGRLWWIFLWIMAIWGGLRGAWNLKQNHWLYLFLLLTILYFPAISAMNWMAPRFRLSINHLLFLLFAQSAVYWWNKRKLKK